MPGSEEYATARAWLRGMRERGGGNPPGQSPFPARLDRAGHDALLRISELPPEPRAVDLEVVVGPRVGGRGAVGGQGVEVVAELERGGAVGGATLHHYKIHIWIDDMATPKCGLAEGERGGGEAEKVAVILGTGTVENVANSGVLGESKPPIGAGERWRAMIRSD